MHAIPHPTPDPIPDPLTAGDDAPAAAGPKASSAKRVTNALARPATLPSRVVVSGGRSIVALPATPEAPASGFASALAGGELRRGFGGLGDRGTGDGVGPGNDSGRLHVGDFWRSAGGDGLPGVF